MLIALILAALLATDVAVAVLYFSTRPGRSARAVAPHGAAAREIEELVVTLRRQAEQASAEIGRQKAQLRRLLAGMDGGDPAGALIAEAPDRLGLAADEAAVGTPAGRPAVTRPAALAPTSATPEQIRRLASEGLPPRAIAGRTRLSVEEVRLMLALSEERKSA